MLASIAKIVEQFKQQWTEEISDHAIENAVREAGRKWRDRTDDPRHPSFSAKRDYRRTDANQQLDGLTTQAWREARGLLPSAEDHGRRKTRRRYRRSPRIT